MSHVDIDTVKSYFQSGNKPSRQQFEDQIDTLYDGYWHVSTVDPLLMNGFEGQYWLNETTMILYRKEFAGWVFVALLSGDSAPSMGAANDFNVADGFGAWEALDGDSQVHFRYDFPSGRLIYTGGSGFESERFESSGEIVAGGPLPTLGFDDGIDLTNIRQTGGDLDIQGSADNLFLNGLGLKIGYPRLNMAGLDETGAIAGHLFGFKNGAGDVEMIDPASTGSWQQDTDSMTQKVPVPLELSGQLMGPTNPTEFEYALGSSVRTIHLETAGFQILSTSTALISPKSFEGSESPMFSGVSGSLVMGHTAPLFFKSSASVFFISDQATLTLSNTGGSAIYLRTISLQCDLVIDVTSNTAIYYEDIELNGFTVTDNSGLFLQNYWDNTNHSDGNASLGATFDLTAVDGSGGWIPMDGLSLPHLRFDQMSGRLKFTGANGIESETLNSNTLEVQDEVKITTLPDQGDDTDLSLMTHNLLTGVVSKRPIPVPKTFSSAVITGWKWGTAVTINVGNPATFDMAIGACIFEDWKDPQNPIGAYEVQTMAKVGVALDDINADFTIICLDKDDIVVQIVGRPLTNQESRQYAIIATLVHISHTQIDDVSGSGRPAYQPCQAALDTFDAIGVINNGNVFTPNGPNLQLDKTAGSSTQPYINARADGEDPAVKTNAADTMVSFIDSYRGAGVGEFINTAGITTFNTTLWDDSGSLGTLQTIPNNKWAIRREFYFGGGNGNTVIPYPQAWYDSKDEALAALDLENNTFSPILPFAAETTAIVYQEGETSLEDASVEFIDQSKSSTGGISTPTTGSGVAEFNYTADTGIIVPPPGTGAVVWNNATQASATSIFVSNTDGDGDFISDVIGNLPVVGDEILLFDATNTNNFQKWEITNINIGTNLAYGVIPVYTTHVFSNNDAVVVTFKAAKVGGQVDTVGAGTNVVVSGSATSPIIAVPDVGVETLTAGTNITITGTAEDPIINATGAGGGGFAPILDITMAVGSSNTGSIDVSAYKFIRIGCGAFFSSTGTATVQLNGVVGANYFNTWNKDSNVGGNDSDGSAFESDIPLIRDIANDGGTMLTGGGSVSLYLLRSDNGSKSHLIQGSQYFETSLEKAEIVTTSDFSGQEGNDITSVQVTWTNIQNTSSLYIEGLLK